MQAVFALTQPVGRYIVTKGRLHYWWLVGVVYISVGLSCQHALLHKHADHLTNTPFLTNTYQVY